MDKFFIKNLKWIYFVLALLNLIAISYALLTSHRIGSKYNETLKANDFWVQQLNNLNELQNLTLSVNQPGNDIFISGDTKKEKERLKIAIENFNSKFKKFKYILKTNEKDYTLETLVKNNDLIELKMAEMIKMTDSIFKSLESNQRKIAASIMGHMDQKLYEITKLLSNSIQDLNENQTTYYKSKEFEYINLQRLDLTFSFFIFLILIGIGLYGSKISKLVSSTLEEKVINEEIIKALNESAIVSITDVKGVITYVNDKIIEISKYSKKELLGKTHKILNSQYHPKEFFEEIWNTILSGNVWKGQIKNKRKDGSYYWVESSIVPMKNSKGEISQFIAIRNDITSRKELELELSFQKRELDQFFDLSLDLLCIAGTDGFFKKTSTSFERVLGYSSTEISQKPFIDLIHPEDIEKTLKVIEKMSGGQPVNHFVNRYLCKNGNYIHISWCATPTSDGKLYAIGRDITEQIKLSEALIKTKDEAEKASKTKAQFLANMSHEIRTPLNGIIGISNLLEHAIHDSTALKQLKIIQNSSETLLHLINDILDFSKLEVDKVELENKPFSLLETVDDVIQLLLPRANEKNIGLFYHPENKNLNWILGDVTRFKQILVNLIGNSIKFTEKGSVQITSSQSLSSDKKWKIEFKIKDTGIGIPENVMSKLFQSFSQVDASTTRRFGGSGLGLAISKGLCEKMGGTINVESTLGVGSTFIFTFLAEESHNIFKSHTEQIEQTIDSNLALNHPLEIIVADDNKTNQIVALGFLKKLGYKADVANDGNEVLKLLENKSYDLILMDCHMPELDGYEATRQIISKYQIDQRPKIVALTASVMKEDIDLCYSCGMDGFISKPIGLSSLAKILRECSSKSKSNAAA